MTTITHEPLSIQDLPWVDIDRDDFLNEPWTIVRGLETPNGMARSRRGVECFTYDACQKLFTNLALGTGFDEMYQATGFRDGPVFESAVKSVGNLEGAAHLAIRSALARYFTPDFIERLRPVIRSIIEDLVDEFEPAGVADLATELLGRIPSTLFSRLVGAPREDARFLERMSDTLLAVFQMDATNHDSIDAAYVEMSAYVQSLAEQRSVVPGEDVVSHLLEAERKGTITRQDVLYNVTSLLRASTDTTAGQIGNVISTLVDHPGVWAALKADQSLIPGAVMEAVRWRPGAWSILRVAREPVRILGLQIEPDDQLFGLVVAAHRDPDVYDEPDAYLPDRTDSRPTLNWGVGRHFCIGRPIAVVEMEETVRVLTERWGSIHHTDGGPKTSGRPFADRPDSLPVQFQIRREGRPA